MEAEIYKITSVNDLGTEVTAYALPSMARLFKKMMSEQYGNADMQGMSMSDLPEDVRLQLNEVPPVQ